MLKTVVVWLGFLGSWLLFMGPVYQAALELSQENDLRDELGQARMNGPDRLSPWWWLLPPVHLYLQRRRSRRFRRELITKLSPDSVEALVVYLNKANGWLYVAGGGLLIAVNETGELCEHQRWPVWVFVGVSVVMAAVSLLNVTAKMSRGRGIIATHKASPADGAADHR